jgi:PTS system ascorbate-specific IIA component
VSVSLLLVCHGQIGQALLDAAIDILGQNPMRTLNLAVSPNDTPEAICKRGLALLAQLPVDEQVLVLTDMLGSTPCNVAAKLRGSQDFRLVTGLNLPMLLHVLNHADNNLEQLTTSAQATGRNSIVPGRPQSHAPHHLDNPDNNGAVL